MQTTGDLSALMELFKEILLKGRTPDMPMVSDVSTLIPKKVLYNKPATIVFWGDGTKTVAICSDDTEFDEYTGFCVAVTKKIFGSNDIIRRIAGAPKWAKNKSDKAKPDITSPAKPSPLKVGDVVRVVKDLRAADTRAASCVVGPMLCFQGKPARIADSFFVDGSMVYKLEGTPFLWDPSYLEKI